MAKKKSLCERARDGEGVWLRTRRVHMRDADKLEVVLPTACLEHLAYNEGYEVEKYSKGRALVRFGRGSKR